MSTGYGWVRRVRRVCPALGAREPHDARRLPWVPAGRPAARLLVTGALVVAVVVAGAGCGTEPARGAAAVMPRAQPGPGEVWETAHTTRLPGRDPIETAVRISELVYAATRNEDKPDAVILVRVDRPAQAILAANRLIHFPTNAPLLYVEADRIPEITRAELDRLRPEGNFADGNVKAYVVGDVGQGVLDELDRMGLRVRRFDTADPFVLGEMLDSWSGAVHADHPDEVVVVPIDSLAWALPFAEWNAHMGQGFFFITRDSVPAATARALKRRFGRPYIFVIGGPAMVSPAVTDRLADLGFVERLEQPDVYSLAVFFAGFREEGRNFGYWVGQTPRDFGWGIQEEGHNYTFANPANLMASVPAAILGHLGKHGPMLLVPGDSVPGVVAEYLAKVRPEAERPAVQQLNWGWVIGDSRAITAPVQAELDRWLAPKQAGLPTAAPPPPPQQPSAHRVSQPVGDVQPAGDSSSAARAGRPAAPIPPQGTRP